MRIFCSSYACGNIGIINITPKFDTREATNSEKVPLNFFFVSRANSSFHEYFTLDLKYSEENICQYAGNLLRNFTYAVSVLSFSAGSGAMTVSICVLC